MTTARRKGVLLAVMFALMVAVALWASGRRSAARAEATRAAEDLAACRSLALRIEGLRHRPNLAGAQEMELAVLARQVEKAAGAAGIATRQVVSVRPEPARRVGETVYKEKPTTVLLEGVSTRQLVVFLHTLTAGTPGLSARSLRLSAERGRETLDSWRAEAVVGYLIYSPPRAAGEPAEDRGY